MSKVYDNPELLGGTDYREQRDEALVLTEVESARLDLIESMVRNLLKGRQQGDRFRGLFNNLNLISNPKTGDAAVTSTDLALHIWTGTGWANVGAVVAVAPGAAPQAPAGPAVTAAVDAVQAVPTEAGLLLLTGTNGDVRLASDTGNMFKWTNGAWAQIGSDLTTLQNMIARLSRLIPSPSTTDVGKALVATGAATTGWRAVETQVTVLPTTKQTPATNPPLTPRQGAIVVNSADLIAWVYDGTNWQLMAEKPTVLFANAASDTVPRVGTVGSFWLNQYTGEAYVRATIGWMPIGGGKPSAAGQVLTAQASGPPKWASPAQSSILLGVIAATATDPHEYLWTGLAAALPTLTVGGYLIVDHVPTGGVVPAGAPGIAGQTVAVGDWVVAVDTDADGHADTFHIVHHDVASDLPGVVSMAPPLDYNPATRYGFGDVAIGSDGHYWASRESQVGVDPTATPAAGASPTWERLTMSETWQAARRHAFYFTSDANADHATRWSLADLIDDTKVPVKSWVVVADDVNQQAPAGLVWLDVDNQDYVAGTVNPPRGSLAQKIASKQFVEHWRPEQQWVLHVTAPPGRPFHTSYAWFNSRQWDWFKVGQQYVVGEVSNGMLPAMAKFPSLTSEQPAKPGDVLVPVDLNNDGTADDVLLIRQDVGLITHHDTPAEGPSPIYFDRGIPKHNVANVANNVNTGSDAKLRGRWEITIFCQPRAACDLSLIFHTGHMNSAGSSLPTDAPAHTADGKEAFGPWNVKAGAPTSIRIIGDLWSYSLWRVEFSSQDASGNRIFDVQTRVEDNSGSVLPAIGLHTSTGNIYARAFFTTHKEAH